MGRTKSSGISTNYSDSDKKKDAELWIDHDGSEQSLERRSLPTVFIR